MIRAFIFDLDGTLYPRESELYREMSSLTARWFQTHLAVSEQEFSEFYEKLKADYPSPLEAICRFELSVQSYHSEVFDCIDERLYSLEGKEVVNTVAGLPGEKFIVTLSSECHIKKTLRSLGVARFFSGIYNPGSEWQTSRKIDAYELIRKRKCLHPEDVCVVGDNYAVDIKDAREAGYRCILVSGDTHDAVPTIRSLMYLSNIHE